MDDEKSKVRCIEHRASSSRVITFSPTNITNKAHTEKQHGVKMKLKETLKNQRLAAVTFCRGHKHNMLVIQPLVLQTLYYNNIVNKLLTNNTNNTN